LPEYNVNGTVYRTHGPTRLTAAGVHALEVFHHLSFLAQGGWPAHVRDFHLVRLRWLLLREDDLAAVIARVLSEGAAPEDAPL
jgi:hypothetical protein